MVLLRHVWMTIVCLVNIVISYGSSSVFYRHVGCYKDKLQPNRALPVKLSSVVSSVMQCYQLAKAEGYQAFGTQWGRQCWAGSDATDTYSKHGVATNCTGGMGGWLSNDVYLVKSSGAPSPIIKCYILKFSFRYENIKIFVMKGIKLKDAVTELKTVFHSINTTQRGCKNIVFDSFSNMLFQYLPLSALRISISLRIATSSNVPLAKVNSMLVDCITAVEEYFGKGFGPRFIESNTSGNRVHYRPHISELKYITSPPSCCLSILSLSDRVDNNACACSKGFIFKKIGREIRCEKCGENKFNDEAGGGYCKACPNNTRTCGRTGATSSDYCKPECPQTSERCPSETTITNKTRITWNSTAAGTTAEQSCPVGLKNSFIQRLCHPNGSWGEVNMSRCLNRTSGVKSCKPDITYSLNGKKFYWDQTKVDVNVNVWCPGGKKLQASRLCYTNGSWSKVKMFECQKGVKYQGIVTSDIEYSCSTFHIDK